MITRIVKHGIAKIMFEYWVFVILWQTFRPVANRSIVDSLVKIALFGVVILHAIHNRDTDRANHITAAFILFAFFQYCTISRDQMNLSLMITVAFMFLQIITFLILQRNEEISLDSLEWFGRMLILFGVILGTYSILFKTERFIRAFTRPGAYGSECKSFLYSNHEYALYLSGAIIFAVWFFFRRRMHPALFFLTIIFLTINLISTFSRTAIIGCFAAVIILSVIMGKKSTEYIIFALVAVVIAIFQNSQLRIFVFQKILKNSYVDSGALVDKGRSQMYKQEIAYYLNGSFLDKILGHGYSGNMAGGHDAYLVILNTGGLIMFLFFIMVIFWSLNNSFICYRINRSIGSLCFSLQVLVLLYMVAQTPILFYSTMDAFFITMLAVLVPLYVSNALLRSAKLVGKA